MKTKNNITNTTDNRPFCNYCSSSFLKGEKTIKVERAMLMEYGLGEPVKVYPKKPIFLHQDCYDIVLNRALVEYERGTLYGDILYGGDLNLFDLELGALGYPADERKEIIEYVKYKDEYRDEMIVLGYISVFIDNYPDPVGVLPVHKVKKIVEEFKKRQNEIKN